MSDVEQQKRIYAAALLAASGKDQALISRILGTSQSTASRLLSEARNRDWLVQAEVMLGQGEVDPEIVEGAEGLLGVSDSRLALLDQTRPLGVKDIHVVQLGAAEGQREFGRACAPYVASLLSQVSVAATSWGRTLSSLIHFLPAFVRRSEAQGPFTCVPLSGEPFGIVGSDHAESASRLAGLVHQACNADPTTNRFSFTGVPAFIPTNFDDSEKAAVEKLIRRVRAYSEVFPPMGFWKEAPNAGPFAIDDVELVMTGVGAPERALGFGEDLLVASAGIDRDELTDRVAGDIGGVLIPRRNLPPDEQDRVEGWNRCFTGIKKSQLERIARDPERAGIVVVANGESKSGILSRVIELGLCQYAVLDRSLAEALSKELHEAESVRNSAKEHRGAVGASVRDR